MPVKSLDIFKGNLPNHNLCSSVKLITSSDKYEKFWEKNDIKKKCEFIKLATNDTIDPEQICPFFSIFLSKKLCFNQDLEVFK